MKVRSQRPLAFFIFSVLVLSFTGCGSGLSGTDQKFSGPWAAEKVNGKGDRIMLVFNEPAPDSTDATVYDPGAEPYSPYDGEYKDNAHTVKVVAIRPGGSSYVVDSGYYDIEKDKILFDLSALSDFSSAYAIESGSSGGPAQLSLGGEIYFKVSGNATGPQLGGQVQISQVAADESVVVGSASLRVNSSSSTVPPFVPGQVIVRGRTTAPAALSMREAAADGDAAGPSEMAQDTPFQILQVTVPEETSNLSLKSKNTGFGALVAQKQDHRDRLIEATLQKVAELRAQGYEAGLNYFLKTQSYASPTDTLYGSQWNLDVLNLTDAWQATNPVRDVVVAVVDTGIRPEHPDLQGRLLAGYDFIHDKIDGIEDLDLDTTAGPDSDPTDPGDHNASLGLPGGSSWHGTHIAGIIGAKIDNAVGIAGIAPRVKILPLRAMGFEGNGTLADVSQAIRYAAKLPNIAECSPFTSVESGIQAGNYSYNPSTWTCHIDAARPRADIINLSLGAAMDAVSAGILNDAINAAVAQGSLVIASAGNEAHGPGYCLNASGQYVADATCNFYPAANANVLSIGAVYANLAFATSYSNYGGDGAANTQFLVAPGGSGSSGILSTVHPTVSDGYAKLIGTSQAAAHVSGVAALLWADRPTLTIAQMKQALSASAVDLGAVGRDKYYGYGLVNACGALMKARELTGGAVAVAGSLKLSAESVNFGALGTTQTILVQGGCGSIPGLTVTKTAQSGGEGWLTVSLTGASTPAQLKMTVNRAGLAAGDYRATVTVKSTTGASKTIDVTVKVGATSATTEIDQLREEIEDYLAGGSGINGYKNTVNLGEMIILLVDASSGEAKYYTKTDLTANYMFQFAGIPAGRYYLIGGVDDNLDGKICVESEDEPCFGYPTLADPDEIEVTATTQKNDLVLSY